MGDVTALMMDVITEVSGHTITPMAVSVCLTPAAPSPIPIPYPVIGSSADGIIGGTMRTKVNGSVIATVGSAITDCHGNEPGSLKEVVSLNVSGPCFLVMGAPIVLAELGMMGITGSMCISNKAPDGGGGGGGGGDGDASDSDGDGGDADGDDSDASGASDTSNPGGDGDSDTNDGDDGPGDSSGPSSDDTAEAGHPVDVVSGHVVDTAIDVELPGLVPFVLSRRYSSGRRNDRSASLGQGWAHAFEQRITEGARTTILREAEGRSIYFSRINEGESTLHRRERLVLTRDENGGYRVRDLKTRFTSTFAPPVASAPAQLRSISDDSGNALQFEHDGTRLTRATDTAGREIVFAWDGDRIVRVEVRVAGALELWVDYAYTPAGCLASATDALGHSERYEYDAHQRMVSSTLKNGTRFQYEYEPDTGRCARTWGPKGLFAVAFRADPATKTTWTDADEPRVYTWDDDGHATREALPDGTVISENAYDMDGYLVAETNGVGEGFQYYFDERGNRVRLVDPAGNAYATVYESDLPRRTTGPDGLATEYGYDERGRLVSVRTASGRSYAMTYDDRGRLTAVSDGSGTLRSMEYDGQHNVVGETDASGGRTAYSYDALGRAVSCTDPLGRTHRATYDRLGRRLSLRMPDGSTVTWAYDELGNVVREADRTGRVTQVDRGGMGAITKVTKPDGAAWTFKHSATERLTEIKNPRGEAHAFLYDQAGRAVLETTFDGRELRFAYGPSGRVSRVDFPDGSYRAFSYDRLGNLVAETSSDATIAFSRDRTGRVLQAIIDQGDERVVSRFERDPLGRVIAAAEGDRVVRYTYDGRGRVASRALPDGTTTRYVFDKGGDLSAIEHRGATVAFERDLAGREVRRTTGTVDVRTAYDALDRLIEQRAVALAPGDGVPAVLAQRQYRYDPSGRVSRIDDARWGAIEFRHDVMGSLVELTRGAHREAFAYDEAGSLVAKLASLEPNARGDRFEVGPGNLIARTDEAKYTHDACGRRIVKLDFTVEQTEDELARVTEYVWDARDRLIEVRLGDRSTVRFAHDAFGRRVKKQITRADGGLPRVVRYVWDGDLIAAEVDSERGARSFVHAPDSSFPALQEERGEVFTIVTDHVGTAKELVDPTGRLAWAAAHAAWGSVDEAFTDTIGETNRGRKVSCPFRLLGQFADEETGLCHTRYREFDPQVGRWMSPDPLGVFGGLDLFGFNGSPVHEVDPLGLSCGPTLGSALEKGAKVLAKDAAKSIHISPNGNISVSVKPADLLSGLDPRSGKGGGKDGLNSKPGKGGGGGHHAGGGGHHGGGGHQGHGGHHGGGGGHKGNKGPIHNQHKAHAGHGDKAHHHPKHDADAGHADKKWGNHAGGHKGHHGGGGHHHH